MVENMIKNLNNPYFFPYGRILGERLPNHGFLDGAQWETRLEIIAEKPEEMCVCDDAEVYLDFERGMAVLLVALSDGPETPDAFYLDKSIRINRGVRYCVFPFDQRCAVLFCAPAGVQPRHVPLPVSGGINIIAAGMRVPHIFTLFYQEKEEGFFFRGESHRQYELTYMDKGSMHSIVGGRDYCLSPGEMMLYGPNQWHAQHTEGSESVCFLTVTFDMDCDYADILLNKKLAVDAAGAALLNKMLAESRRADALSGDMICCFLMEFLLGMIRLCRGERGGPLSSPYAANSENRVVDQALRYIAENIFEKLTVAGVAEAVNVCPSYLAVLFSRHLKTRPGDYIRREKLEEGKLLIRQGNLSLTQIAARLKFSSVHHFSYQFRRWYGMTPSEFARSIAPSDIVRAHHGRQDAKEQE